MTVPPAQSLEKKENQPKAPSIHIPTFWSLLYGIRPQFVVQLVLEVDEVASAGSMAPGPDICVLRLILQTKKHDDRQDNRWPQKGRQDSQVSK